MCRGSCQLRATDDGGLLRQLFIVFMNGFSAKINSHCTEVSTETVTLNIKRVLAHTSIERLRVLFSHSLCNQVDSLISEQFRSRRRLLLVNYRLLLQGRRLNYSGWWRNVCF